MKHFTTATAALALFAGAANAGGLDRSGQSVLAIFNDSGSASFSVGVVNPKVRGTDTGGGASYDVGKTYTQMGADYTRAINQDLSFSLIYDQPFGADIFYNGNPEAANLAGTEAALSSDALSFVGKYKINDRVSVFGGIRAQRVGGRIALNGTKNHSSLATAAVAKGAAATTIPDLTAKILGGALQNDPTASAGLAALLNTTVGSQVYTGTLTSLGTQVQGATANIQSNGGYLLEMDDDWAAGFTIGAAYEIPDIALRFVVTYHSEIDHDNATTENINGEAPTESNLDFFSPQSVNLEFQTGIAADTLLTAGMRWTNWGDFDVIPTRLGADLANLEDSYRWTLGVGRKFSEEFSGSISMAYEEAGGKDNVSPLGPNDGQFGITLGMRYQDNDGMTLSGGVNYTWLGDTDVGVASQDVARFEGNSAFGFGLRATFEF